MYDIALWKTYSQHCVNRFRSAYHKCMKMFLVIIDVTVLLRSY